MPISFADADRQQAPGGEPIPDGTVAPVIIQLRELKDFKTGGMGLDLEFTVTDGDYSKRKAWKLVGVEGNGSKGHDQMVAISRAFLRAVLESASGIMPEDNSPAAIAAREINNWDDFNQVEFLARFGIEKGKEYTDQRSGDKLMGKDKNTVFAVTPDDPDYADSGFKPGRRVSRGAAAARPTGNGAAGASSRPSFAQR